MDVINTDNEFERLQEWIPILNVAGAGEDVPEIERYICTIKDRVRSTY